jgi:hypothetical protein
MSQTKTCGINYFCVGAMLLFGGSISLIPLGFTYVLPYTSTSNWLETMCTVVNSSYNMQQCTCNEDPSINKNCVSKYPCLRVFVEFSQTMVERLTISTEQSLSVHSQVNNISHKDTLLMASAQVRKERIPEKNTHQQIVQHKNILKLSPQRYTLSRDTGGDYSNDTFLSSATSISLLYRSWSDAFYKTVSFANSILSLVSSTSMAYSLY